MVTALFASLFAFFVSVLTFPLIFWALIAIEVIGLIYATEEESLFGAFTAIVFGGFLGVLEFGSFSAFTAAIFGNPLIVAGGVVAYFVLGTLWSRFKWGMFVGDKAKEINGFIEKHGYEATVNTYSTYVNGEKNTQEIIDTNFACLAPKVGANKKKITTWIILWVPSAAWFLLNDPIRRIANSIFDGIKVYFQSVSDSIFKKSFKINPEVQK